MQTISIKTGSKTKKNSLNNKPVRPLWPKGLVILMRIALKSSQSRFIFMYAYCILAMEALCTHYFVPILKYMLPKKTENNMY